MTLILSGTDGLSEVDGTAATPAIRGTDANTGIFFPAADTIAFAEGGAEAVRIDSSGQLGIGTTTPSAKLEVSGSGTLELARFSTTTNNTPSIGIYSNGAIRAKLRASTAETALLTQGALPLLLGTNDTENARIDSSGNLLVGTTSQLSSAILSVSGTSNGVTAKVSVNANSPFVGQNSSGTVTFNVTGNGQIVTLDQTPITASNVASNPGTAAIWDGSGNLYKQSSSMRYKENIAEWTVTNAQLDAFVNLNPKLWDYIGKENGCAGFIAEDIEALGLKNAYNTSPLINYSNEGQPDSNRDFALIAMQHKVIQRLEKSLQEQQALITALTTRITALEAA